MRVRAGWRVLSLALAGAGVAPVTLADDPVAVPASAPVVQPVGQHDNAVAAITPGPDVESDSGLPISLLPPVPRGLLHPEPGMYLLCPKDAEPGCTRINLVEDVAKAAPLPEAVVVLVHGLDDSGDVWRELAPALHDVGRAVVFFEYPNDQGIALSAEALAAGLRSVRSRGVERVDLVCHSMGGLVARDALTRTGLYAGSADGHEDLPEVDRLILIATPNAGAPIAWVRAPNDLIERSLAWRHYDAPMSEIFDLSSDGDGRAGVDLRPGSEFLTDLNARPAPTGLHTTVVVAQAVGETLAPEVVAGESAEADKPRGVRGRVRNWWSRVVREVILALGDGAVPIDSARLAAADETLIVRCSHVGLLKGDPVGSWILDSTGQNPQRTPAVELVLERVSVAADGQTQR